MKQVKYIYNKENGKFEPAHISWRVKIFRFLGLLSAVLVSSAIVIALAFKYIGSPKEKKMEGEFTYMEEKMDRLKTNLKQIDQKLADLEQRDNGIYRSIFEAEPLPIEIRSGRQLLDEREMEKRLSPYDNVKLFESIEKKIGEIEQRLKAQQKSYDQIYQMIKKKEEMLMSIPSIQPVNNTDLKRIASGFGKRIDPIYKIPKFHAGLDFSAPTGTPIYSTGDGLVEKSGYNTGGYGNEVWINHGYGYKTHYAHMVKIKTGAGRKVKRGEVIGWVGSTGKSTGPHLHYEIERKGVKIDPIHFFYNDLKPEEYERVVKLSQAANQSFD